MPTPNSTPTAHKLMGHGRRLHHLVVVVVDRLILIRPVTSARSAPGHPYFLGRPPPGSLSPTCRAAATGSPPSPPRGPRSIPETEWPHAADARARPPKKSDVSSDRIGAASRRPRVGVNWSEAGPPRVRHRGGPRPHVSLPPAAINARLRTRNKFQALLSSSYH